MQATLSLLQTTTTTTKKRSRRQRTVSPGFHAVFICGTAYPGSEQQTRFLKPCQLSPGIWQSWPLLLFTLAQTFSPSPCCVASSPPPAASGGEAPSMGNVRAKCHRLRSPLIYGPFTPRGEILSHVIFGSWSAEDELQFLHVLRYLYPKLHVERVATFWATNSSIMQLHLSEGLRDAALALLVPELSWERGRWAQSGASLRPQMLA